MPKLIEIANQMNPANRRRVKVQKNKRQQGKKMSRGKSKNGLLMPEKSDIELNNELLKSVKFY